MRRTRFLLVRHGQTAANGHSDQPVLSGTTDLPLTDVGHRQASAVARSAAVRDVERVYASPLQRARATAAYIAEPTGLDVVACPGVQEIDCGQLEGMPIERVRATYPDVWAASQAEDDETFRWPGGESYAELRERSVRAIGALADRHHAARILIVTHAGVISQVVGHLRGVPASRWSAFRPGNASITELDWSAANARVVSFDRRDHLPVELQT